ncbi:homeobox-leucine zipper protein HAT22-like protein [Cinnamomum micranthum f. kanehirae]|uniref:Homeobox-leucine zipper protein HAT22-like protein n=1 Tax=Cinnamomum micranthum f. kanehirae TaxID=337451 RepID=A0A3S4NJ63_9MAGN|nr:homeobox-leucine zipper protein HAT22-like protein [Cinnamomum micranthum f. kanehirae]
MGTEDVCNAGLVLGLNIDGVEEKRLQSKKYQQQNLVCFEFDQLSPMEGLETCLTLSLVPKKINKNKAGDHVQVVHQSSSQSTVSSFSNPNHDITSSNRERDDFEVERLSLRVSDEEDEGSAKKKLRLTKEQSALLEDNFKEHTTLDPKQKKALAAQLNLRPRQVEVWFQNRRARTKLKQTEVECEYLKRCCQALKEENRRLQKEVHELKALKLASPLYMHVPAATLTMCPSCERIGSGSKNPTNGPFAVAPRSHHLYNSSIHHQSPAR